MLNLAPVSCLSVEGQLLQAWKPKFDPQELTLNNLSSDHHMCAMAVCTQSPIPGCLPFANSK